MLQSLAFQFKRCRLLLLPVLLLLVMTLPHLDQGDFRRDTRRYAAIGLHMWTDGTLLHAYLNPETPYFDKCPMVLWIYGLCLKLFGVHLAVARAPSIAAALGVLCLSILAARRLGSRAEALVSGLVLALTIEFTRRTREISLDFWQLLFIMAAAYAVITAARLDRRRLLLIAGIFIGLALLCKPLFALVMVPLFALWLRWLGRGHWWRWVVFGTLPMALLVAVPWHLYMWHEYGPAFTDQYFFEEVVHRAMGAQAPRPPQYYLLVLVETYWPWALAVGYAVYARWRKPLPARRPARDLLLIGGASGLYLLLLLSLFTSKQINFALPLYPMLSWVAAAGLCRLPWAALRRSYQRGFAELAPVSLLLLLLLSLAPIQFHKPPSQDYLAVFRWLDQQAIPLRQLAHDFEDPDELCYFYLKRGHWLPSYNFASTHLPDAARPTYVLKRFYNSGPPSDQYVAFQSGEFAVLVPHPGTSAGAGPAPQTAAQTRDGPPLR